MMMMCTDTTYGRSCCMNTSLTCAYTAVDEARKIIGVSPIFVKREVQLIWNCLTAFNFKDTLESRFDIKVDLIIVKLVS